MASFKDRVESYIGDVTEGTQLGLLLTTSAVELINLLPDPCLWQVSSETIGIQENGYAFSQCRVLDVTLAKSDGTILGTATIMPPHLYNKFQLLGNRHSLYAGSPENPIYFLRRGKIFVYPFVNSDHSFNIEKIDFPTIDYDDTDIKIKTLTDVAASTATPPLFTYVKHGLLTGDTVTLSNWTADSGGAAVDTYNLLTSQITKIDDDTFRIDGLIGSSAAATGNVKYGAGFPDEMVHLIVLNAAIKYGLKNLLNEQDAIVQSNSVSMPFMSPLPPPPIPPTISEIDYSHASNADASSTTVNQVLVDNITGIASVDDMAIGTAPQYVQPSVSVTTFPHQEMDWSLPPLPLPPVADWSVIQQTLTDIVLPAGIVVPTMNITEPETIVWNLPPIPIAPSLDWSGVTQVVSEISLPSTIVAPTFDIDEPEITSWDFPAPPVMESPNWSDLEGWMVAEDTEMVAARIQAIQASISEFSNAVQSYQTQVNTVISENQGVIKVWSDEWGTKTQNFSSELNAKVQLYQAETGGAQAIASAQVAVLNAQIKQVVSKNQAEVAQYQALISSHQAVVNAIVAENQGKVQTWSQEWSTRVNRYVAEIGAMVKVYEADISAATAIAPAQVAIRQAQVQEASNRAQTDVTVYQSEIAAYQAQIKSMIERNQGISKNWSSENTINMQKYQSDMQDSLNSFQAENAVFQENLAHETKEIEVALARAQADYQTELQRKVKNAEIAQQKALSDADNEIKVSVANKAQDQVLSLQNRSKDLDALIANWNAQMQLYSQDTQKYQSEVNTIITKFSSQVQLYQSGVQELDVKVRMRQATFEGMAKHLAELKARYQEDLAAFMSKYVPQQGQQGQA